jgi:voltage-gated potassium channel Kch
VIGAILPWVEHDFDPETRLIYFSFATLTTVGYGDITPVHPIARSLAMLEALIGQLFPVILIARLVSMELYYRRIQKESRK